MNSPLGVQQTDYPVSIVILPSLSTAKGSGRSESIEDSDLVGKNLSSSFKLSNLSTCKPFRITSLAHPRMLSSVESHPCKKDRGGPLPCPSCASSLSQEVSSSARTLQICTFIFNHFRDAPPATFSFSCFCIVARGWIYPVHSRARSALPSPSERAKRHPQSGRGPPNTKGELSWWEANAVTRNSG